MAPRKQTKKNSANKKRSATKRPAAGTAAAKRKYTTDYAKCRKTGGQYACKVGSFLRKMDNKEIKFKLVTKTVAGNAIGGTVKQKAARQRLATAAALAKEALGMDKKKKK